MKLVFLFFLLLYSTFGYSQHAVGLQLVETRSDYIQSEDHYPSYSVVQRRFISGLSYEYGYHSRLSVFGNFKWGNKEQNLASFCSNGSPDKYILKLGSIQIGGFINLTKKKIVPRIGLVGIYHQTRLQQLNNDNSEFRPDIVSKEIGYSIPIALQYRLNKKFSIQLAADAGASFGGNTNTSSSTMSWSLWLQYAVNRKNKNTH